MNPNSVFEAARRAKSLRDLHRRLRENYDHGADRLGVTDQHIRDLEDAADDADDLEADMRRRLDARA